MARAAVSRSPTVLLNGESGTGKDLIARIIHHNSDRATEPFVNINCWELPELLLESELFGGERGAFTGADVQKSGLLEVADGGTVFLEHADDMPPKLQVKLLRFIEELIFRPIGGSRHVRADVRVIAGTTRKLEEEVARSRFSADLYYRLNVPIVLPALRAHPEDIPLLVAHFVNEFNTEFRSACSADACRVHAAPEVSLARQCSRAEECN